jgi:hypothetical protein
MYLPEVLHQVHDSMQVAYKEEQCPDTLTHLCCCTPGLPPGLSLRAFGLTLCLLCSSCLSGRQRHLTALPLTDLPTPCCVHRRPISPQSCPQAAKTIFCWMMVLATNAAT